MSNEPVVTDSIPCRLPCLTEEAEPMCPACAFAFWQPEDEQCEQERSEAA